MGRTIVRGLFGLLLTLVTASVSCGSNDPPIASPGPSQSPTASLSPVPDSPYLLGFRRAYLPVVESLNEVTGSCARSDMRVALLPACGRRVSAVQLAIRDLERYVTTTTAPDGADASAHQVAASLRDMHGAFDALAARIESEDLDGFLAMGGMGGPIDTPIQAFVGAVRSIDDALPGEDLPLPG